MNLWKETLGVLKAHKKTWEDVRWVGTYEYKISKDNFELLAKKTNYDSGYGAQEVASDLLVVGADWYLRREEYDGAENWDFISMVEEPSETRLVERLTSLGWETLSELNDDKVRGSE